MIFTGQMCLVGITCDADHATRFAGVNVVMEATGIVVTTSGVQEGATDSDHGGWWGTESVAAAARTSGSELIPLLAPRGGSF